MYNVYTFYDSGGFLLTIIVKRITFVIDISNIYIYLCIVVWGKRDFRLESVITVKRLLLFGYVYKNERNDMWIYECCGTFGE